VCVVCGLALRVCFYARLCYCSYIGLCDHSGVGGLSLLSPSNFEALIGLWWKFLW